MEGAEGAAVESKDDTAKRHTYALVRVIANFIQINVRTKK